MNNNKKLKRKAVGIEVVEDRNYWSPRQFLLNDLHMDLFADQLTHSELKHLGYQLKRCQGHTERN